VQQFHIAGAEGCAPLWVMPFEFHRDLWCQKTRIKGLSYGIICMFLRLAILIQYRSVTHTHRHRTTAYIVLSVALHGKNWENLSSRSGDI